jgi:hypothetical protein
MERQMREKGFQPVLLTRERDRMIQETLQQMESQIEKMLRSGGTVECGLPTAVLENGKVVINAFHGAILFRCDPKWTTHRLASRHS